MKMVGAFSGEAFNHLNMHVGKRGGLVEIVVNNYSSHAVVGNLSSFRGVENTLRAAAPAGQVFRPDVMVTLLGFKVFARHVRPFHWVLARKLSAYEPCVQQFKCLLEGDCSCVKSSPDTSLDNCKVKMVLALSKVQNLSLHNT